MRSSLVFLSCCFLIVATVQSFNHNNRYLDTNNDTPSNDTPSSDTPSNDTPSSDTPSNDTTSDDPCIPDQVRLSLGDAYYHSMATDLNSTQGITNNSNATAFVVWQTREECKNETYIVVTVDRIGTNFTITGENLWHDSVDQNISAKQNNFGGVEGHYTSHSHTALLHIEPDQNFTYTVYQTGGLNARGPYTYQLPALDSNKHTRFAIYGDIDSAGTHPTLNWLKDRVEQNSTYLDMHLCLGDLAYDIYSENGARGEQFFNEAEPSFATLPFMISPGNHEWYQNYTFLNFRTRMPLYNLSNNHYYSFNLGKIHFIAVDTFFWLDNLKTNVSKNMFDWIANDLELANKNRDKRPWIVIYSHRPLYCSYNDLSEKPDSRCYAMYSGQEVWDELYYKHKVDLVLQAHVHYWERTGPVYQNRSAPFATWSEETRNRSLINPSAPIYTVEGAAGNSYFMVPVASPLVEYSINTSVTIGVSIIETVNDTALLYKHVNSIDSVVVDHFYVLKGDQYPMPTTSTDSTVGPNLAAKGWLIALIVLAVALLVGVVIYRRYRSKQLGELQQAINAEKDTEAR